MPGPPAFGSDGALPGTSDSAGSRPGRRALTVSTPDHDDPDHDDPDHDSSDHDSSDEGEL